jgi:hypothetical protein
MGEDTPKVRNITSVPREGATIRVTRVEGGRFGGRRLPA